MLSINTNLSSLIAQGSMKSSTNKLNQAIERMTTGFKINHAKDNAANYSIATNMTTKIGAYNVAEDNAAMGLDLISTAEGTLSQIEDKLQRLRALAEQASNGTYGEQSLNAINAEANALVDEINRLYSTAQFNGVSLYDSANGAGCDMESLPEAGASGFIKEIQRRDTSGMTKLANVAIDQALTSGTYSISTAEELAKLATMTNNGLIGENTEFVLANDIDLSGYSSGTGWIPIGEQLAKAFRASFDGNGYTVKNLTNVDRKHRCGLFGFVENTLVKNLAVIDASINGNTGAILAFELHGSIIDNCYTTGEFVSLAGGAAGFVMAVDTQSEVHNSYSIVNVRSSADGVANIAGFVAGNHGKIIGCYSTGIVDAALAFNVGGFAGISSGLISNCYATGNVSGSTCVGGLVGWLPGTEGNQIGFIENCYASGSVSLSHKRDAALLARAGGLFGAAEETTIKNCASVSAVSTTLSDSYELCSLGGAKGSSGTLINGVEITSCLYDGVANAALNISSDNVAVSNVYDSAKSLENVNANLQVGIKSDEASQISVTTSFKLGGLYSLKNIGLSDTDYLTLIDDMLAKVSEKQTEYGATSNRLESVLEEITIQRDNLVSSRSTIRDADIAEVSSHYIQQQILQQASATLLATANQSPSIALQLI